ncbi:MAG: hypothetical protein AAF399_26870, partial [Bacteroidota bacterium]
IYFLGMLLIATVVGIGQTVPTTQSDTLRLGTEGMSPAMEEIERAFFQQMDAHNQQIIHLRDSLQAVLYPTPGSSPVSLDAKEQQELEQCLKMYVEMLETNQRLMRGQGRIKATF